MTAIGGSRSKNSTILLLVLSSICCSTFAGAFSITTPSTSSSSSTSTSFSLSLSQQQQQQPCDVPSDVDDDATLLLKDSNSIRNAVVINVDGEKLSLGDLIGIGKDDMTSVVVFLRHMG